MNKSLFTTMITAAAVIDVAATGYVSDTAGSLSAIVDPQVTELAVTGPIDVRDIYFIGNELHNLTSLDLSKATIEAYTCTGQENFFDQGQGATFAANELPPFSFFGEQLYTSVVLPSTLTSIGEGALAGTTSLASISLPASVTAIGDYAFNGSGLTSVTVPGTAALMGKGAFSSCENLSTASVASVAVSEDGFALCPKLATVELGNSVSVIGAGAFSGCGSLTGLTIAEGSSLSVINDRAFLDSGLETFPIDRCPSLNLIGSWAFSGTAIHELILPSDMQQVPEGLFFNAQQLSSVTLASGTTTIGAYAFHNATNVATFLVPATVEYIDDYAMSGMTGLRSIIAQPTVPPSLGEEVFAGIEQSKVGLSVADNSIDDYKAAEQWREFNVVGLSSTDLSIEKDGTEVNAFFTGSQLNVKASLEIQRIVVVDMSGAVMALLSPASTQATIDTSGWSGNFYVVNITLAGGNSKVIKLMR